MVVNEAYIESLGLAAVVDSLISERIVLSFKWSSQYPASKVSSGLILFCGLVAVDVDFDN